MYNDTVQSSERKRREKPKKNSAQMRHSCALFDA